MSVFKPFKAVMPRPDIAHLVGAPPYDVLSAAEAIAMVKDNPLSYLVVEKSEVDYSGSGANGASCHRAAKERVDDMLARNILVQEKEKIFYVYRQSAAGHTQHGIVGVTSVEEYLRGKIKKHELTRVDKEAERAEHIDIVNAHTGPVFIVYPEEKAIDEIVFRIVASDAHIDFIAHDGTRHSVWKIADAESIAKVEEIFSRTMAFYIADGHHRAAAAAKVATERGGNYRDAERGYLLSVLFPDTQAMIIDYNRVVKNLNGHSGKEFLQALEKHFVVFPGFAEKKPASAKEFGMYLNGAWYRLRFHGQTKDNLIGALDVSILQDFILAPLLGIGEPRTDRRIDFIGGKRGMAEIERLVDSGDFAVGFSLYPTSLRDLMAVAEAGEVMPPKSTWFEPKLMSGLFTHLLD